MALRSGRKGSLEYRPLKSPRPERTIVAVWPKQRPPGRAGGEFLKEVLARFKKDKT
jgi:LysR family hydrogen peroxide-inducible transcriptional activator